MGKHETKYNRDWEKTYGWSKKVEDDVYSATCSLCDCTIQVKNGGISQLKAHANTNKHKEATARATNETQSKLVSSSQGVQLNKSK